MIMKKGFIRAVNRLGRLGAVDTSSASIKIERPLIDAYKPGDASGDVEPTRPVIPWTTTKD